MATSDVLLCTPEVLLPWVLTHTTRTSLGRNQVAAVDTFSEIPTTYSASRHFHLRRAVHLDGPTMKATAPGIHAKACRSTALAEEVMKRIRDTEWTGDTVAWITARRLNSICLYLINNLHVEVAEETCKEDAMELVRMSRPIVERRGLKADDIEDLATRLGKFMELFIQDMHRSATEGADKLKSVIFNMQIEYIWHLFIVTSGINSIPVLLYREQLGPPSAVLPPDVHHRLVLAMLHPDPEGVLKALKFGMVPAGSAAWDGYYERQLRPTTPGEWEEVLSGVPSRSELERAGVVGRSPRQSCVTMFEYMLWEDCTYECDESTITRISAQHGRPEYVKELKKPLDAFSKDTMQEDTLKQIITLFMPNWMELWPAMGWTRTHEIMRRLVFIRDTRRWTPDPELYKRALFEGISAWGMYGNL